MLTQKASTRSHQVISSPELFHQCDRPTQGMSLVAHGKSCGRLNGQELRSFVLEYLQEKSPSNLCCYFCVSCLQWKQEFTMYFCALL